MLQRHNRGIKFLLITTSSHDAHPTTIKPEQESFSSLFCVVLSRLSCEQQHFSLNSDLSNPLPLPLAKHFQERINLAAFDSSPPIALFFLWMRPEPPASTGFFMRAGTCGPTGIPRRHPPPPCGVAPKYGSSAQARRKWANKIQVQMEITTQCRPVVSRPCWRAL